MHVERTRDTGLVVALTMHPAMAGLVSDDRRPSRATARANAACAHDAAVHLAVYGADATLGTNPLAGLVSFRPEGPQESWRMDARRWVGHFALLPGHGGVRGVAALRSAFGWMWAHTRAGHLAGVLAPWNPGGLRVCRWAGMRRQGWRPAAFLRGGQWHDGVVVGIGRPPVLPAAPQHRKEAA